MRYHANYSKINRRGQMKIQEMSFVLVAIMIFFGIVVIFVLKIGLNGLKNDVSDQRAEDANELVRKIASIPEFAFTATDCDKCIDLDKVMALKGKKSYFPNGTKGFWDLDYLQIRTLYPLKNGECRTGNYPDCQTMTLINNSGYTGIASSAYVALCRQEFKQGSYIKCELGRISASGKSLDSTVGVTK